VRLVVLLTAIGSGCGGVVASAPSDADRGSDASEPEGTDGGLDAPLPCTLPSPAPAPCEAGGCPVTILATGLVRPFDLVDGGSEIWFLGNASTPDAYDGGVFSFDKTTFTVTSHAHSEWAPFDLGLSKSKVFWANSSNASAFPSQIRSRQRDDLVTNSTVVIKREIAGFAVDDDGLYWVEPYWSDSPGLFRMDPSSATPTAIASSATGGPTLAGDHLLFFEGYGTSPWFLSRVSKWGGAVEHLSSIESNIYTPQIAFDEGWAAWPTTDGIMVACVDAPGAARRVVESKHLPLQVALHGGYVYWVEEDGPIERKSLSGGPTTVVAGVDTPASILLDETRVYWTDGSAGTLSSALR
jgi:hypothetical protein